jgi:hypothetical protein
MLVYSSDIYLLCHKFTINYTMKFIKLRVKIQHSQEPARRVQYWRFLFRNIACRVATIIELGNHEIFKQSILKFDILINSHIVYSNIWSPYLVKVRMSVAILSHISGNVSDTCMLQSCTVYELFYNLAGWSGHKNYCTRVMETRKQHNIHFKRDKNTVTQNII